MTKYGLGVVDTNAQLSIETNVANPMAETTDVFPKHFYFRNFNKKEKLVDYMYERKTQTPKHWKKKKVF